MKEIKKGIIQTAKGYNKYLTDAFLNSKPISVLLRFIPIYEREYYHKQIGHVK